MSEEEKKAVDYIKKEYEHLLEKDNILFPLFKTQAKIILNLIENQQKEINNIKEIEQLHKEENGKLRVEFEKVYEDNLTLAKELEKEKERNELFVLSGNNINLERHIKENYISKDKIKAIVDEHIPKQPNIITGEVEYTPNTNANSLLVQDILELLEEK